LIYVAHMVWVSLIILLCALQYDGLPRQSLWSLSSGRHMALDII
jgi:hypothetical protein